MSDHIPLEIQMDIIQRIPDIKSLIQFRSVSKEWKSVIDSKDFVTAHTLRHQAHHHLLIRTRDRSDGQVKYVSIVDDDDTFPHQKLNIFVPDSVEKLCNRFSDDLNITGTSHGLFCLYKREPHTAVIWNPCIRKTVVIAVPNVLHKKYYWTVVGFGVCPWNLDPKLVKISYVSDLSSLQEVKASTQVEVFTLSSGGTWRSPLSSNLPHKSIGFEHSQAVVDGFIYWKAFDRIHVDDGFRKPNLIMSFDLTSEEFTKVNLPDPLARYHLTLSNLRDSLAVLELDWSEMFHVWQMIGYGCTRSFNKLYSINGPNASISKILGFRKTGAPVVKVKIDNENDYDHTLDVLAIYEPKSKSITNMGIQVLTGDYFFHSYMETLLLLDD